MRVVPAGGAEEHAEAAWRKLRTPGEGAGARVEAIDAFQRACRAIEARGPEAIGPIAALVRLPMPGSSARALAAARILAEIGTTEAAKALVDLALQEDIVVAGRALEALPSMRCSQAAQALLVDAVSRPAGSAEAQRRSLLADGLGRQLVAEADFEATLWARSHPLAYVRASWARALARTGGAAAQTLLAGLLDDEDAQVRAWAAFGLVLEGRGEALSALVRCAGSRRSDERAAAIGLLGVLPIPDAVAPVIAATADRSPLVARAAIVRAGQSGVRGALLAIAAQLENKRTDVVEQAAWSLRELLGADPGFAWVGRRLTPASAIAVTAKCRATHELWPNGTRFSRGRLLTAEAAARSLDGTYGVDPQAAYFTLFGMSGRRFGYDPGADEIANRNAARSLAKWAAEHSAGLIPGAFYFGGQRL